MKHTAPGSLAVLMALALTAGPAGCSGKDAPAPPASGAAATARAGRRVPVEVRPVEARIVKYSITTVGALEAREVLRIPARVAGVVQDVAFQEGTSVTPGKVLARIDRERYELAAQQAEAAYRQAEAATREAEAALDKRKALHERDPGWVTDEELSNFTAQLDGARAALAAAKAASDLARKDLRDSEVRAEYAGIIDEKRVDTGQYVTVGTVLASLVNTARLKLSFNVSETESARLSPSSRITFQVKAIPGRDFEAKLYHVGEMASSTTRMVECLAWVDNRERLLRPGFFADVTAEVEARQGSIVVPQTAMLPTERGFVVWVVRDGDAVERRQVRPGLYTRGGEVEILDGLAVGERLVVRGAALLAEGMSVNVTAPPAGAAGPAPTGAPAAAAPTGESAP